LKIKTHRFREETKCEFFSQLYFRFLFFRGDWNFWFHIQTKKISLTILNAFLFYCVLSNIKYFTFLQSAKTFYANPCEIEKQFYSFKNVKFINTCKRIEQKNVYGDKNNNNNNKSCSIMSHYFIYNRRPVWIGAMYVLLYEFDTADNKYFFTNIILCRTLLLQSDVSCYLLPVEHTSTMCRLTFVRTNFHCYSFDDFV